MLSFSLTAFTNAESSEVIEFFEEKKETKDKKRIKGDKKHDDAIKDTIELVSPVVAELAAMYGKVERGEVDLFDEM